MSDEHTPQGQATAELPAPGTGQAAPQPQGALQPMPAPVATYTPWKRPRTYVVFILGTTAAGCMIAFFHPVFALMALGHGIPAVILANREMREVPQSASHPFIKWGKRTGLIGLIGGPIVLVIWIIVLAVIAGTAAASSGGFRF